MFKKNAKYFLFLLLLSSNLWAQVSVETQVDKTTLGLGDMLRLSVIVSGTSQSADPQLPDLAAFDVVSSGRSQSISVVNGKMSSTLVFNYGLSPKGLGRFTIDPVTITVEGKQYHSAALQVEVVKSAAGGSGVGAKNTNVKSVKNAFVKMIVDKPRAYVGQQIILTFQFFYRLPLVAQPQYQAPALTGFLSEKLPSRDSTQIINGVQYRVSEVRTALFAAQPGRLTIPAAQLDVQMEDVETDPATDDFFASFFGAGARQYRLQSDPIQVDILPLPTQGRTSAFSGGVGHFKIERQIEKGPLYVGRPFTLNVTISGQGNLRSLGEIQAPNLADFRQYDATSDLLLDDKSIVLSGRKNYKFVWIAQSSGKRRLDSFVWQYFDPVENKYKTLTSAPLDLQILPAPAGSAPHLGTLEVASNVQKINQDIRYLSTDNWQDAPSPLIYKSLVFKLILGAAIVFLFLLLPVRRYQKYLERDPKRRRFSQAAQQARKSLQKIDFAVESCAQDLSGIWTQYWSAKLALAPATVSLRQIEERLTQHHCPLDIIASVRKIGLGLEQARFAPDALGWQSSREYGDLFLYILPQVESCLKPASIKKLPFLFVFAAIFCFIFPLHADDVQSLWQAAQQNYKEAHYDQSAQQFASLAAHQRASGGISSSLLYNWANACYKNGQKGQAIALWTQAWRQDPLNADIRYNLNLATQQTTDPFFPQSLIFNALFTLFYLPGFNVLCYFAILSIWVVVLAGFGHSFKPHSATKVLSLLAAAVFFVSASWFLLRWNAQVRQNLAVTCVDRLEVRSGPGDSFAAGFVVPQGYFAKILAQDSASDWVEIAVVKQSVRGWVKRSALALVY